MWLSGKESACQYKEMQETQVQSLDLEDPLEEEMATHSSILVWKIPWMEEPGGLQSMGSRGCPGEGNGLPTPVFWPGEFYGLYSPWGHKET